MPQPSGASLSVNYPSYQGFAVAKQGNVVSAWDFILLSTIYGGSENVYVKDTGAPAAQRPVIAAQQPGSNL